MKKLIFITLILTIFSVYSKVTNLSTNSTGLSLIFDISDEYQVKDLSIEGDKYKKFVFSDDFAEEGNLSETEYFSQNSKVDLNFSNVQISKFIKSGLIPARSPLKGPSGIITMEYKEPKSRNDLERSSVEIEYIGRIRDHNLYKLTLYPLIFNGNGASLISKVRVSINFNNSFTHIPTKTIVTSDMLEEKILNFSYSKVNPFVKSKTTSSVFLDKQTEWLKLKIAEEGIYRVTGQMISDNGIDIGSTLTSKIKVYSSAGEDLSIDPSDSIYYHGANEIAREIVDVDGDGVFESNDYIEFYAQSNHSWKRGSVLEHYYNNYSEYSYYWIDLGIGDIKDGKVVEDLTSASTFDLEVSSFDRSYFYDNRDEVLYSHYKHYWFTKSIYPLQTVSYGFPMKNIDASQDIVLKILNASISYGLMKYKINNDDATDMDTVGINFNTTFPATIFTADQINTLSISNLTTAYNKYLYGFEIHYKGTVTADDENEYFVSQMDTNQTYKMNLSQASGRKLFDITDPYNVRIATLDNDQCTIDPIYSMNHFMLSNDEYLVPQNIEVIDYTAKETLHSITEQFDMVIISPDDFFNYYSNDDGGLIEAHLNAKDPISSIKVVNINDINNEFGRGYQEPSATRNFIKYAFENWGTEFILIGADGNYNYKDFLNLNEKALIYPSDVNSGSDDFYANLKSTSVASPNVSIGRFAVTNLSDLENIIEKTVSHINSENLSNMNTRILLVGDDEHNPEFSNSWNEKVHIKNVESLIVPRIPGTIFTDKLFMTEYPFEYSTSTGLYLKPRAADELIRKLEEGVNLFIYVGHGAPAQLAHEKILTASNYALLDNYNKYFFQIGATCDFGVFNDPYTRSLSEKMLTGRNKGSIGLINAVEATHPGNNEGLVGRILSAAFNDINNKLTIGEALMEGKLSLPGDNSAAYMLLGDPALRFFKDKEVIAAPDTVRLVTLKLDTITTRLNIPDSLEIQNKNGIMNTMIIDSEREVKYFNDEHWDTDDDDTLRYTLPGKVILSALSTISDGESITEFILPKDLTYGENKGKIVYYGYNSDKDEFSGYTGSVSITGEATPDSIDSIPPDLSIFYNSLNSIAGDPIGQNPTFFIKISDENGVNTSGGIGHKLMMDVDGDQIELNDFFQYDLDTYKSGYAKYQLFNLTPGKHIIKASAWDTSNNYNEITEEFKVISQSDTTSAWVGNLLNYPNPIKNNGTTFGFAAYGATVIDSYTISVYTINGRKIKVLKDCPVNVGDAFQYCEWDGRDSDGDIPGNGVYIYTLRLKFLGGKTVMKKGKLIFAR
jgi:hypothetical protein